ncbi:MAG: hypothetical protein KDF65_16570, partial [Anaerolineae bacterium]|nr:hypothetical protein [Anaerolineae bacterium]
RADLLAQGRIPDPFFGEDYQESLWVEKVDWWYRRDLDLDPLAPAQRAFLICDGIDYRSAIFVNGQEHRRHEGMFSRQIIEITEALHRSNGRVELAVRLWGSGALPRRRLHWWQRLWQTIAAPLYGSWVGIYPDRTATLKCQMSFGWDFAPPLRTMGLWDEVRLVITGPVFGREAQLRGVTRGSDGAATLSLDLSLDTAQPGPVMGTVHLSPANFAGPPLGPFPFGLELPAGISRHCGQIDLPKVALWQPWDRGFPHLYDVAITLTRPDGQPLDELTQRTGFRTINLHDWQFTLNGQPEFIRGVNWVPADSLPGRLRRADYERLLRQVRQGNANLLRVWGGGLREKQAFYDLCDELGLLVWQEFPFACLFLGSYPRDSAYLALVEAECGAIVRQLTSHPALVLWCGGNEFSRRRNRPLLRVLAAVVEKFDGSRPFLPTSPGPGDAHHWQVWHGQAPLAAYQTETAPFLSEFGLQALPHVDTLAAMLPSPYTAWASHQADSAKLRRYLSITNYQLPITKSPNLDAKRLISQSQLAQALALQIAIEHMRRRKGQSGGVCLWQFNEPWPAISWAIIDYFGRPKLAYRRLADWYNPVLLSLKFPLGRRWQMGETLPLEIWAINDTLTDVTGCTLELRLDEVCIHRQPLDVPAQSAQPVGRVNHLLPAQPRRLSLSLSRQGLVIAQNHYDLTWVDLSQQPHLARLRRWVADWVLR